MSSPEHGRSDPKRDKSGVDEESGGEKKKQKPENTKKSGDGEHIMETGESGRGFTTKQNDSRKRSGNEEEYETRKDLQSAQLKKKKKQEESALEKLRIWYCDGGEKRGGGGSHESRENSLRRETGRGSPDSGRTHRRRWDEDSEKESKYSCRSENREEKRKQQSNPPSRDREASREEEKAGRRGRHRSPTPERGGRRHREVESSETEHERAKRKEKEGGEKAGGTLEWDGERGRGGRKDWRNEAVKTSSNFGISNDNYDVIEIQTRPLENGRDDFGSSFPRRGGDGDRPRRRSPSSADDSESRDGKGMTVAAPASATGAARAGGRGRPGGRDGQQLAGVRPASPFVPLGITHPQPLAQAMPSVGGVFLPPFSPPVLWPGVPPRFHHGLGTQPGYFNDLGLGLGPGRGFPHAMPGPVGAGREQEKVSGGWVPPPRMVGPPGRAPSRGEQNDYSQNFVDTGMRPQNFIRELELTNVVEDYPKLRELIQKKDDIVAKAASPPMYLKCDLHEHGLSSEFFGTKFDVILVDPPWEEYVHRAPGAADHMSCWSFEDIMNLKIEAIADTPSFIFLWVGDGVGLQQGRQCLKKWGFRRCEDICWVKTNKTTATPGLRHDSRTLFQHSKEHCLMGIKGTVRRSTDGHIIHANIDTDVIIAEEPPYGSTAKPEDMYRIIEHFSLGRRRLELFGEDHNIRSGWLTVGKGLSSSNFNTEAFVRSFSDKDGRVWQGGGGRNPPPESPHLVLTTPDIESLRPKSPMKTQLQIQQQPPAGPAPAPKWPIAYPIVVDPSNLPAHWPAPPPDANGGVGFVVVDGPRVGEGYGQVAAVVPDVGEHVEDEGQRASV